MHRLSTADDVLPRILAIRSSLHNAGALSARALEAIAELSTPNQVSVETGCGVSTLLLSHLSSDHTVFAQGQGNDSVTGAFNSHLLNRERVELIEGPTQRTLPRYDFHSPIDLALLDGPHAYPFPQLEYYFVYPHLKPGGILVLDDIQIPTVHHLFQFLRADSMYNLERVVDSTAFFRRTKAPTFAPDGDGWEHQLLNRSPLLRYTWRERLRGGVPQSMKRIARWMRRRLRSASCHVSIRTPTHLAHVSDTGSISGAARLPPGLFLWVLVRRQDTPGWWPQGDGPTCIAGGAWSAEVRYGEPSDAGSLFEILASAVGEEVHRSWLDWRRRAHDSPRISPVLIPEPAAIAAEARRTVRRSC